MHLYWYCVYVCSACTYRITAYVVEQLHGGIRQFRGDIGQSHDDID
jgi:hypothetical protein